MLPPVHTHVVVFGAAMAATTEIETPPDNRVWTIPNALSLLRLLGVPLFLWLALGPHADGWALVVLMVAGITTCSRPSSR
jgi:cardiolipin synthase